MAPSGRLTVLWVTALTLVLLVTETASQTQAYCRKKLDLCFVIDQSGSIVENDPNNWRLVKDFVYNIIRHFDIGYDETRVGLVTFANYGITRWNLTAYFDKESIRSALYQIPAGNGRTNTYMGLRRMREEVFNVPNDRTDVKNVAIVVTDGKSTINTALTVPEAEKAHAEGIQIFVVGVTGNVNENELKAMSSPPHEINKNYWTTPDFTDLTNLVSSLQTETCSDVISAECQQADIALLVDSSTSVRFEWDTLKDSLKRLVDTLKIGRDQVRVGIINFSGKAKIEFDLDSYLNKDTLKQAIDRMSPLSTDTKTYTALELAMDLFTPMHGSRSYANNIAILFTDGEESNPEDSVRTMRAATALKESGVRVLVVGIGNNTKDDDLKKIASTPLDVFFSNFDNLLSVTEAIVQVACSEPVEWNLCDIADIVLVLDRSTSITHQTYDNWRQVLRFADDIVGAFGVGLNGTHWGVVTFSTTAKIEFYLDRYYDLDELRDAINNKIRYTGGETNIADALRKTRQLFSTAPMTVRGDRPNVKDVVIFLTDGNVNKDWVQVQTEIRRLKDMKVEVFAIGVTDDVNTDQLNEIATAPNGTYVYRASDFNTLRQKVRTILKNACIITTTTTTSTTTTSTTTTTTMPPTTTTTRRTTTTTTTPSTTTTTTTPTTTTTATTTTTTPTTTTTRPTNPPFTPSNEIICIGNGADIVFVMDASGSINEINFKKILDFVGNVVLTVDLNKVRIGAMTFSDDPRIIFQLDRYTSVGDMVYAIRNVYYDRKTTNTAAALRTLRTQMFTPSTGDRPDYPNMALIITDGESNDKEATLREATLAKTAGIQILTVGIGSWLDMNELQNMASYPYQKNMYHVDRFDALSGLLETLRDYICGNKQICNVNNPCRNGGRCEERPNGYNCVCQRPYTGQNCTDKCDDAADVVIALDASGSIGKDNFRKALDFLAVVIESLDVDNAYGDYGTKVGFLTFSNNSTRHFDLKDYNNRNQLVDALSVRYVGGTTNTASALRYIRQNMFVEAAGDRPRVKNYVILLTDGQADDADAAWEEARQARASGIQILAVGIGQGINRFELESIVSEPSDRNVLVRTNFENLDTVLRTQIISAVCANNKICRMQNPCRNGARCTDLMNGYSCDPCPSGYAGINCDKRCDGRLDLAFVLDSSGSIRIERFPEVKEFLVNITKRLDINQDRVRVGMVYWSDEARLGFRLNSYSSRQDVINAIRSTPFLGAKTNTASALAMMRKEIFQERFGDRSEARNLAVVLSDGNSNINSERTFPEAAAAREDGIYIMGVVVGNKFANMVEMEGIASIPAKKNVFNVEKFSELNSIVLQISESTCDEIDECLSRPCLNGGTCRNDFKRYICDCLPGYVGYNCQDRCSRQLDVVFVLDISGSVESIYQMTVAFAKEVVYGLDMTLDRTRVAALTYSTTYNEYGQFFLNTYSGNKQGVINAMNFYHNGGRTNTQQALQVMRTQHFTSFRGDRAGVQNVAILVTDGYSNEDESNTIPEATMAKNNGIKLYTVGLGDNPNMIELNSIASDPDSEYVFRLRNMEEVPRVASDILRQLCQ